VSQQVDDGNDSLLSLPHTHNVSNASVISSEEEEEIDAAAALALADEILKRRNIKTFDLEDSFPNKHSGVAPTTSDSTRDDSHNEQQRNHLSERKLGKVHIPPPSHLSLVSHCLFHSPGIEKTKEIVEAS
jgi:hypothetical protein